ncbi:unnamed protein product [Polarella glacialis]|uniref:Helicase ATP-binding domain-containing protein n=1 Tax=Polarella glacialis TaxID=89957 RepID=A0A813J866_POLGL|nr:unnamed protein product [Polarella glacialis]
MARQRCWRRACCCLALLVLSWLHANLGQMGFCRGLSSATTCRKGWTRSYASTGKCSRALATEALHATPPPVPAFLRLPKQPRHYQEEAVAFFFEHASATGQGAKGRPLRMRLVCGSGKTFIYGLIISRDLVDHPTGQSVVLVPWRDLARQTALELEGFGLRVCVIGDESHAIDEEAHVVVCVYASAHYLQGRAFRIKIVDEAHHVHAALNSKLSWETMLHGQVKASLEADFSATFQDSSDIDFDYGFTQALRDGYVCDLEIIICLTADSATRLASLADMVHENQKSWSPMFIMFNTLGTAKQFAATLRERGLGAQAMGGTATRKERLAAHEALQDGGLNALCLVRLFNEGTSISELRTVVMAEPRRSSINIQQVAMRVIRTHSSKPDGFGRFVQAVGLDPWIVDDSDLRNYVLGLTDVKQLSSLQSKTYIRDVGSWIRCQDGDEEGDEDDYTVHAKRMTSAESEDANSSAFVDVRVFDSAGQQVGGEEKRDPHWLLNMRLQQLRSWQHENGGVLPSLESSDQEEKTLAQWLTAAAQRASSGSLSSEAMRLLKEMPGMPSFLDETDALNSLVSWVETQKRLPTNAPEIIEQGQYRGMREFRAAFLKYTLTADDMRRIRRVPELYHYITQPKSATSWRDSLADVISWIEENEQLPSGRSGDELEQLQYRRIQQLRWYYFGGLLSSEDMQTLRDTPELYDLTRASWLCLGSLFVFCAVDYCLIVKCFLFVGWCKQL